MYWIISPDTRDTEFSTFLARDAEMHARLRKGVAGAVRASCEGLRGAADAVCGTAVLVFQR